MSDSSFEQNIQSNIYEKSLDEDLNKNKYVYPEWYNNKKKIFYKKILHRLRKLRFLHTRASQYYEKTNYYIVGPSISITALSGIASFLSTSQFIDNDTQNVFGVGVGILASVASVLQALSGACQFNAKQEAHRTVAEQYNNLIVKVKFEMEMPNEEEFVDNLEKEILDIQNKCNYFVPQFIFNEWKTHKQHFPESQDQLILDIPTQTANSQNTNI